MEMPGTATSWHNLCSEVLFSVVFKNGATPTSSLTWAEALNQPFSSPNGSNNVAGAFVTARAQDAMKATTTLLAQVDLKVAGLYSLLVMLAQVMKYPYLLATNFASFEDVSLCLQLEGLITHGPADALVVPTAVVTPDLLHVDAREPSLDYSTLGVMLLVEWAHAVSDRRPELTKRMHEYAQCIRKDAASLLLVSAVASSKG
ncbi:hypothetical protein V5799_003369 [Amblyomma americanum]|uniref:Uncharacterized protein n=1 Tax=Amblyomma americanum TaxID=6943 RepID=A0AAQ4D945_AMBAM